jgi:hypothetical protein
MAAAVSSVSADKRAQTASHTTDEEYDKYIRTTINKTDRNAVRSMSPEDVQGLLGVSSAHKLPTILQNLTRSSLQNKPALVTSTTSSF